MSNRQKVIIDCDPGIDDIFALIIAKKIPQLQVMAITAVAGNVELKYTGPNALKTADFVGFDVPVALGASQPLNQPLHTAAEVHGVNGMLGLDLPLPHSSYDTRPAWEVIYQIAKENPGEVTLIATGPFTNVATAYLLHPDLKDYLKRIVVMGGAFFAGNTTPATEFNVYVDPEACEIMLHSGTPVYMCPLDVTHKAYVSPDEAEQIGKMNNPQAQLIYNMSLRSGALSIYSENRGIPQHDPCAVMFAAYPEMFTYEQCSIVCETQGLITRGKTITDEFSDKQMGLNNAYLVYGIDRPAFVGKIMELIAQYN